MPRFRSRLAAAHAALTAVLAVALGWSLLDPGKDAPDSPQAIRFDVGGDPRTPVLTVDFNASMRRADELGRPVAAGLVALEPAAAIEARFVTPHRLVVRTLDRLPPGRRFELRFGSAFSDAMGRAWEREASVDLGFETGRLGVTRRPAGSFDDEGRASVELELNDRVLRDQLRNHLRLQDSRGRVVPHVLQGSERSWTLRLEGTPPREATLILRSGITGLEGRLATTEDQRWTLRWSKSLRLNDSDASYEPGSARILLRFSHPFDPTTADEVAPHVQTFPAPDGVTTTISNSRLVIRGPFAPGAPVRIRLLAGLRARAGVTLKEDVERTLLVPNAQPSLLLSQRGRVLSRKAVPEMRLSGVNVGRVEVSLRRMYANNLVQLALRRSRWADFDDLTSPFVHKTLKLEAPRNQRWTRDLNLEELWGKPLRGVFQLKIRSRDHRWQRTKRILQISDLAPVVRVRRGAVVVWVVRLSTGAPASGARVQVLSRTNQVVAAGQTDETGIYRGTTPTGGDHAPFLVTAQEGDDLAYVDLRTHAAAHRGEEVGGRPPAEGPEAFLYADRGVVRPGETFRASGIVRTLEGRAPVSGLPLRLRLTRPDGEEVRTQQRSLTEAGAVDVEVPLASDAPTGTYRLDAFLPGAEDAAGTLAFRVDDVVPDRLEPQLDLPDGPLLGGTETEATISARLFTGAPARERQARLQARFRPVPYRSPTHPAFVFGDASAAVPPFTVSLGERELNEHGRATLPVRLPKTKASGLGYDARFRLAVIGVSGRAAFDGVRRRILPRTPLLGIGPPRQDVAAQTITFDCRLESPSADTSLAAARGEAILERLTWRGGYRIERGRSVWRAREVAEAVAKAPVEFNENQGRAVFRDPGAGRYRVRLTAPGCAPAVRSYERWGSGLRATPSAGAPGLRLEWAAGTSRPGHDVTLAVDAPFAGTGLLTVEGGPHFEARVRKFPRGRSRFPVRLPNISAPNVHVTLTLIRGLKATTDGAPARLLAALPIRLERAERRLGVALQAPQEIEPRRTVEIGISLRDDAGSPAAGEVRLSLVDEGVLRLTGHRVPNPAGAFQAVRALRTRMADPYTRLVEGARFGDQDPEPGGDAALRVRLDPGARRAVHIVALATERIRVDGSGQATVRLRLPDFEGRLRIVAVACTPDATGASSRALYVRAPLSLMVQMPRAVAPADRFECPVTVRNGTGRRAELRLRATMRGLVLEGAAKPMRIVVPAGKEHTLHLPLRAVECGPAELTVAVSDDAGLANQRTARVLIRPPYPFEVREQVHAVKAGTTYRGAVDGAWLPDSRRITIRAGGNPALELLPALERLRDYPYGCVEQTTSQAFPLLAWPGLGAQIHGDGDAVPGTVARRQRVEAAIDRLLSMQTARGGLATWPGGQEMDGFGSAYAAEFLVAARRHGYAISAAPLKRLLDALADRTVDKGALLRTPLTPYVLYVLAKAKHGSPAELNWMAKIAEEPEARAWTAAGLAAQGDTRYAKSLLQDLGDTTTVPRDRGGVLRSPLRALATQVRALVDVDPNDPRLPELTARLRRALAVPGSNTTQENAVALVALGAWNAHRARTQAAVAGTLRFGDRVVPFDASRMAELRVAAGQEDRFEVTTTGSGTATVVVTVAGIPLRPGQAPVDDVITVRRRIVDRAGNDVTQKPLRQGEVYRVILEGRTKETVRNLLLSDLLPGGLEVERARAGPSRDCDRNAEALDPDRVEPRDDRVLFFRTAALEGRFRVAYWVRAVTLGRFVRPPLRAELLYAPGVGARTAETGLLEVVR